MLSVHNEYLGLRVEMLEPANSGLVSFFQEHSVLVQATAESRRHHIAFGSAEGEPKEGRWVPLQATALRRSARWEELNAAVLDRYEASLEYIVAAARSHEVPVVLLSGARNPDYFQVLESQPPAGTGARAAARIHREHEELAASLKAEKAPAERLAQAEEMLERMPWSPLAHYARAVALTGLERNDEAHDAHIRAHDLSAVPYAETTQTHARLRAVVERHDLPSASIGDWLLMGSPVGLPRPWLFSDDVHPNRAGYGRIGDGLRKFVTDEGLIKDW